MGLEAATFISQLNSSNPVAADPETQGDDHLRMIKACLQASFPNATKAYYLPSTLSKNTDFSVTASQQNTTFLVDTTGAIRTATLPTLTAGDAGWECFFIKITNNINTMFIAPPSGTIQSGEIVGLTKTRRCIPGRRTRVFWTGTAFIAERVENAPVGAILDFDGSTLPAGYEFPNGQTLGANYPDFIAVKGSGLTRDLRGRTVFGKDDMGGSAAGNITTAGGNMDGLTQGATGGVQNRTVALANLPNSNLSLASLTGSVGTAITNGTQVCRNPNTSSNSQSGGGANIVNGVSQVTISLTDGTVTFGGTLPLGGSGTALQTLPPGMVLNKILVVE